MKVGMRGAAGAAAAAAIWLAGTGTAHAAFGLTVAPDSPFAVGEASSITAVIDLNRDGRADVVLSESRGDAVRTFLGDGRGRFVADQVLHATAEYKSADVGDFDGDGAPDIVIADLGGSTPFDGPAGLHVLLNDGAGHFSATGPPIAVASSPRSVTAADATGDGLLDVVTADYSNDTVTVRPGDGKGEFGPPKVSAASTGRPGGGNVAVGVLIADVTDDGKPDSVILGETDEIDDFVVVRRGDGSGQFTTSLFAAGVGSSAAIAPADVDDDGDIDIVALEDLLDEILVFRNDGTGGFTERPGPRQTITSQGSFALGDLDADGLPDLVTGSGSSLQVLLGNGAGDFAPAPGSPFDATGTFRWSVGVGDVDADEDLDVVTTDFAGSATVLLNTLKSPEPSPAANCGGEQPTMLAQPGVHTTGTADADVIVGTTGPDVIFGGGGDDVICARGGDDVVRAGPGDDLLSGGSGADMLAGHSGDDHLIGGPGPDRLFGNAGDDRLSGGDGDDVVAGGEGTDGCEGGLGADLTHSCE